MTIDLIRGKLLERVDPLSQHYAKALAEMKFEREEVTEKEFMMEIARFERLVL